MTTENLTEPKIWKEIASGDLQFRQVSYPANYRMAPHRNSASHLFLCLSGAVEHLSGDTSHYIGEASIGYVPRDDLHADHFLGEVTTFDIVLGDEFGRRYPGFCSRRSMCDRDRPAQLATNAYREFKSPDNLTSMMLEGLTLELLVDLHRRADDRPEPRLPRWLARVRDLLHANYSEPLSLERIAYEAGVHPAHMTRTFRGQFGCSIGEYIRRLRIENAGRLLTESDMPIAEIALTVGFADQCHFTRTFKKYTGTTPSAYQRRHA
ncbi:AraC family transcriptional regulator [Fimbriimonas ginsengisoli]|uniref:AraC family transcriptional regulator n=1 Tax=Fimbriimonas ginsengisoli Gsoil 348 TaxID=661478 RepID=A0A068NWE3_FIMGI|nr:AraC family transcriptional regulator [Fimbriimonas ginsengisoli Gsoil 348]